MINTSKLAPPPLKSNDINSHEWKRYQSDLYDAVLNNKGEPGKDGLNGANGTNGKDGTNGANGIDGRDAPTLVTNINFLIDGGTFAILTGAKPYLIIPRTITLTDWILLADISDSFTIDLLKNSYASFPTAVSMVGAGTKPYLSSQQANTGNVLNWSTAILNAGDFLLINVTAASTITKASLILNYTG